MCLKTVKFNMFKICMIKFKKIFKQEFFSQHRSTKLPTGLNHLKGRKFEKWGLWLQCDWGLRPGKVEGEENVNE